MPILMLAARCCACGRSWLATILAHRLHRSCPFCGSERWETTGDA